MTQYYKNPSLEEAFRGLEANLANLERMLQQPWTAIALSAKVEAVGTAYVPSLRNVAGDVQLSGIVKVKAGQEVVAFESLGTVPSALRPAKTVVMDVYAVGVGACYLEVRTTGGVYVSANLPANAELLLDSLGYRLV